MRLTGRIHGYQLLPVTDGNTPTVSDWQRGEEGSLTSRQKMGLVERQRSLLCRPGPHRIATHEREHEERIKAQALKSTAYLLQQVSEQPVLEDDAKRYCGHHLLQIAHGMLVHAQPRKLYLT